MGQGFGSAAAEGSAVVLSIHAVHNLEHSPTESYYAMATAHRNDDETSITSERSAQLRVLTDSVVSLRVFLHERGAAANNDRAVGQVAIPIRRMLETCGRGLYHTWLLLEPCAPYTDEHLRAAPSRFTTALRGAKERCTAPRVCISLLEEPAEPDNWLADETLQAQHYSTLLVSQSQHADMTRAYFELLDGDGAAEPATGSVATSDKPLGHGAESEATHLSKALDEITDEANQHIERVNEQILSLKAELAELRDLEGPKLQQRHAQARRRLEGVRQRSEELQRQDGEGGEDLEALRREVKVMGEQKAALMLMVQQVYGQAASPKAGASSDA